uniref:Uncharacterized protein n=1 Tax=Arundo donax TaxID=35708 RepID=A0A0A8YZ49_ARUDO
MTRATRTLGCPRSGLCSRSSTQQPGRCVLLPPIAPLRRGPADEDGHRVCTTRA